MRGGLVHHIIKIPAALSLPLLRGAAVGRAPTIFQNDWFCTRISNFFQSPIFSIARLAAGKIGESLIKSHMKLGQRLHFGAESQL